MQLSALLAPDADYDERDLPQGCMEPTHRLVPPAQFTHGHDALVLAEIAGYELLEFQSSGLIEKLGANRVEQRDGSTVERWAAQETADVLSRRNGKSVEIECLILVGLFLLGERKIMYTAHRDDTAEAVFENVRAAIERTPDLAAEIAENGFRVANGQRRIKLKSGQVCYFRTRTTESARGQGYDRLICDESQNLTDAHMAALLPLVSGSPNAQINYAGSAGGRHSTVQGKVWRSFLARERGLCYRGWHAEPDAEFDDLDLVARLNPRLGLGLSYEFVAKEFARMTRADFGRERVGVATYPRVEGAEWVIPKAAWEAAVDVDSAVAEGAPVKFVLEADPGLEAGSIGVAGRRPDRAMHLECVAHDPGVGWMVQRAKELQDRWKADIYVDGGGPLGFMIGDLRKAGVAVKVFTADDVAAAFPWLLTAINPSRDPSDPEAPDPVPTARHRGGQLLTIALAAAETRKIRDRSTLRRHVASGTNQGPIVSVMFAGWAVIKGERQRRLPPPSKPTTGPNEHERPHSRRGGSETADLATADF